MERKIGCSNQSSYSALILIISQIIIGLCTGVNCNENQPLTKKCCRSEEVVEINRSASDSIADSYRCRLPQLELYDRNSSDQKPLYSNVTVAGFPKCKYLVLDNKLDTWFQTAKDGNIEVGLNFWVWPAWMTVSSTSCTDRAEISDVHAGKFSTQALFFCDLQNFTAYIIHRGLYGILFIISSMFVLLTMLIYIALWSEQNTHGCAQFSFFTALFSFYLVEGARVLVKLNGLVLQPTKSCFIHAIIAQYFFVTVNTTSGVLVFDLLWTFWKLDAKSYKVKNRKRIYIYAVISWVIPFVSLTLGLTINHFVSLDAAKNENGVFEHAHYRCSSPLWQLTFYVQSILFVVNITFFVLTGALIWKHRQRGSSVAVSNRTEKHLAETISIFFKLFLVSGMTWFAVIIEFFYGEQQPLSYYWLLIRVVNILMGVAYFICFGCSQKNVKSLRLRYPLIESIIFNCTLKKFHDHCETTNTSKVTFSTCPTSETEQEHVSETRL